MSKIMIVSKDLNIGGVQKSLIELIKHLSKENEVHLFLFSNDGQLENEIPDNVKIFHSRTFVSRIIKYKGIKKEDIKSIKILISKLIVKFFDFFKLDKFFWNFFFYGFMNPDIDYDCLINYSGYKGIWDSFCNGVDAKRKLYWIHNDPVALKYSQEDLINVLDEYDKIVVVSRILRENMSKEFPKIDSEKIEVIYNLIDCETIWNKAREDNHTFDENFFNIVTVIRLQNDSKRVDRLIKTAILLKEKKIKFKWYIIGDGPDYYSIKNWIIEKELSKHVYLLGVKSNPYKYIYLADLFVLTSDYEGLPVTLMEAELLNTKIVTTNFKSAREIVTNYEIGYVVNKDEDSISNIILELYRTRIKTRKKEVSVDYHRNTLGKEVLSNIIRGDLYE